MELHPGLFSRLFAEITSEGQVKTRRVLTQLALAVERQAKTNASVGSHPRGTPTPASPGTGPAVVSGTLRRSITHTPVAPSGTGWETKVGTGVGFTPPYGRTPASRYGLYLETGLKNATTYPFLYPAYRFGIATVAPQLYAAAFRGPWPRA
ncbi:hypothetical protein AB0K09_05795 [Streptomyces sp. NPDC049577]|uniref:hypothetical protein n=1 Tax=Streptomyces sp. NPDC049577 TaxID=3155153 RepID=UPI00341D95B4